MPEDATLKHQQTVSHTAFNANRSKLDKGAMQALGDVLTEKHGHKKPSTKNTAPNKLLSSLIYISSALWAAIMLGILFSSEAQNLLLIEKLQFIALTSLPLLIIGMGFLNLRRNQETAHNNMAMPNMVMPNTNNPEFAEALNKQNLLLQETQQQTEHNLNNMISMVDERIKAMSSLSSTAETEFQNIADHMGKALRDNLVKITHSTQESMGDLKGVIDIIKERENNLGKLNQHFDTLEKDISNMLESRQQEIREQIETQITNMLSGFDTIKDDMTTYQKDMFQNLIKTNDENRDKIQELILNHDQKVQEVSDNVHQRQEDLVTNFENSNNGMYLRIQKILHELNINNDQLVNRVEARQVQMRDLLERNNDHFANLFQQYNQQYNTMCETIMDMLREKGSELTAQVGDGLTNFTGTLEEMESQRLQNEQQIEDFLKNHSKQITEKLSTHHTHSYDMISDHFNAHQNWMSTLVDSVQKSYSDFQKHAQDYKTTFEQTIGGATESTKMLGKNVRDELDQVITSVNRAADHVRQVSGNFGDACEKLNIVNNKSENILEKVDKSLGQHVGTLVENTNKLESCSELIEGNFSKHAHKITQLSTYVKDSQEKAFGELLQNINQRIEFLQDNMQRHSGVVARNLNDSISKQTEIMNIAMQKNIQRIEEGGSHVNETLTKTSLSVVDKFSQQGKQLENNVIQLLQKLLKSSQMLDQGVDKIDGLISNTDERVENIQAIAQKQTSFYEALLERMEHNSGALRAQIQSDQEQLVHAIHDAEEKASRSKDTLLENSDFFIEKTDEISNRFHSIHEKMVQHARMVGEVSAQAQTHCVQMDDKLRGQVTGLQSAISSHNNAISNAFNPAMEQLTTVSESIQERADNFYNLFNHSIDKVDGVSNHLAIRGEKILSIFTQAESSIDKSANKLTHNAVQMDELAKNVEKQSNKFENSVQYQIREIEQCGQDFESRIHNLNGALGRYLNSVQQQGDEFNSNFTKTSDDFHKTASHIQTTFTSAITGLSKNSGEFENHLGRLLNSLQKTGTLVQNHSNQITSSNDKMNEFNSTSNSSVEKVTKKLSSLSDAFDKITDKMNSNINKLSATIADKQSGMLSVTDRMQHVQEQLAKQCREAINITHEASDTFKSLPNNVVEPAKTKAIEPTQTSANTPAPIVVTPTPTEGALPPRTPQQDSITNKIKPVDDAKYRNFMNSARNLIGELHKTSQELSKNLLEKSEMKKIDGDYKTGKQNAFTLHLLNKNNDVFSKHIAQQNLKSFQTKRLLETYQNKFESLMNSAKEFSPDNSLATDFSVSDIGKLYMMLAKISGRTPVSFDKLN